MNESLVKIKIMLPGADWYTFKAETLWATPLGDNLYKIENPPFFADSISYHDVVFAAMDEAHNFLQFKSVRQRSGNSTYRLMLAGDTVYETFNNYIQPLITMGCTYEGFKNYQFSLNVPLQVSTDEVSVFLKRQRLKAY